MRILGHRGASLPGVTENTLPAFEAAIDAGADGVEVDVRVTADGVAVCLHDPDVRRLTGLPLPVGRLTYAQLRSLSLFDAGRVSSLEDVLRLASSRAQVVLDLKCEPGQAPSGALADATLRALRRVPPAPDLVVSSFSRAVLSEVAGRAPGLRRALITDEDVPVAVGLRRVLRDGHSDLHPALRSLAADPSVVAQLRRRGGAVRVWTVNRPIDARFCALMDVDALITDHPGRMRELRNAAFGALAAV